MVEILLAVFATYRIARMLTLEEGAFGAFAWVREHIDPQQATWLGRGVNCPLCTGFWVAGVMAFLTMYLPLCYWSEFMVTDFILRWLGIAGAQVVLHNWIEK